eukprot:gene3922-4196_t
MWSRLLSISIVLVQILISTSFQSSIKYVPLKRASLLASSTPSSVPKNSITTPPTTIDAGSFTLTIPAQSFLESVNQAATCVRRALNDGYKLMEVEFPPLSLDYLEGTSSSSQDISLSNTRWAIEFSRLLTDFGKISIVYPDSTELKQAMTALTNAGRATPYKNITLSSVRGDSIDQAGSLDQIFSAIFRSSSEKNIIETPGTEMYVALVSSTQELPDLERLHSLNPNIPIVFFNLGLDALRGDLGLPLFPKRELHYRFLSKIKPVYLLRSKSFAASLKKPPFIVNYSGLLFRHYPEPYQCILNIGKQRSRVVAATDDKPSTSKFREFLTEALKIPNVDPSELQVKGSLLWWEKNLDSEASNAWRT